LQTNIPDEILLEDELAAVDELLILIMPVHGD
jgi:hypothetical protein